MNEEYVIIDSEGKKLNIEYLYTVDDYITFNIKVKSQEFSGVSNFSMSKESVTSIIENLSIMYEKLKGFCEIKDCDSDANIKIEMDKYGHLYVFGQIGGSHEDHFMKFKFKADQTVLGRFMKVLKHYYKKDDVNN